jgi:hypothetical protein
MEFDGSVRQPSIFPDRPPGVTKTSPHRRLAVSFGNMSGDWGRSTVAHNQVVSNIEWYQGVEAQ